MLKAFNRRIQASQRHIKHLSVASKRTLQQPLRMALQSTKAPWRKQQFTPLQVLDYALVYQQQKETTELRSTADSSIRTLHEATLAFKTLCIAITVNCVVYHRLV